VKKLFARRYASLILNHVAKENAKAATKEALEYKKRKQAVEQQVLLTPQAVGRRLKTDAMKIHGRKISVADYFSQLIPFPKSQAEEDAEARAEEKEAKIRALLGEDPTQKNSDGSLSGVGGGKKGDNSTQIEALHKAGNIFNAILRADRKQVDALLRANPHVLSQRGPVGELPLHMSVSDSRIWVHIRCSIAVADLVCMSLLSSLQVLPLQHSRAPRPRVLPDDPVSARDR
jgi:hypothetical protein